MDKRNQQNAESVHKRRNSPTNFQGISARLSGRIIYTEEYLRGLRLNERQIKAVMTTGTLSGWEDAHRGETTVNVLILLDIPAFFVHSMHNYRCNNFSHWCISNHQASSHYT